MNLSKKLITLIFLFLVTQIPVWACSVCFTSVKTDPFVIAMKWAILTLLGTVGFVLLYFAKFLIKLIVQEEKALKNV